MAEHPGQIVTKFQFCSLFLQAWYQAIRPETIISGFKKSGIYPFNPSAITLPSLEVHVPALEQEQSASTSQAEGPTQEQILPALEQEQGESTSQEGGASTRTDLTSPRT